MFPGHIPDISYVLTPIRPEKPASRYHGRPAPPRADIAYNLHTAGAASRRFSQAAELSGDQRAPPPWDTALICGSPTSPDSYRPESYNIRRTPLHFSSILHIFSRWYPQTDLLSAIHS